MDMDPSLGSEIVPKITVLHPPQAAAVETWDEKRVSLDEPLRFVIVGHLFFMKGGAEILRVFDKLLEKGYSIELNIVSGLATDDWATATSADDVSWAKGVMGRHAGRIHYWPKLDNSKVMALFKQSHVALLPSYAETYGYSVLEAQASGCPVVTTDIGALSEINDDECGWVIRVPKRDYDGRTLGRSAYHTREGRASVSEVIEHELTQIVLDILKAPSQLPQRAEKCLHRIRSEHDPIHHAEKLLTIYREALERAK